MGSGLDRPHVTPAIASGFGLNKQGHFDNARVIVGRCLAAKTQPRFIIIAPIKNEDHLTVLVRRKESRRSSARASHPNTSQRMP